MKVYGGWVDKIDRKEDSPEWRIESVKFFSTRKAAMAFSKGKIVELRKFNKCPITVEFNNGVTQHTVYE